MKRRRLSRLRHQLFVWFALTIVATLVAVTLVLRAMSSDESSFSARLRQASAFAAQQLAERWHDAQSRERFASDLNRAFGVTVWLFDAAGRELSVSGSVPCHGFRHSEEVEAAGVRLGRVEACFAGHRHFGAGSAIAVLLAVCLVLWTAAALVAHRLVRPLSLLIQTTREIGKGDLSSRVRLGRHHRGELGLLADSVNEMAERLERQMREQRELLAAVSHEVRSPLARLRVSAEVLRGDARNAGALAALEREVEELDRLLDTLLANSRLDFGLLGKREVAPGQLFRELLERRGLPPELLEDRAREIRIIADPTLLACALDNLLQNAIHHGKGIEGCALSIQPAAGESELAFEVRDRGPGFGEETLPHAFAAFHRGPSDVGPSSLGLGLSLVRRIAEAHGGRAWAKNLTGGGAAVAFSVPCGSQRAH